MFGRQLNRKPQDKIKTTIHFAEKWRAFFEGCSLTSYEDFFGLFDKSHHGEETKSLKSKSNVQMFTAGGPDDERVFFLKRFFNPGFKNSVRAWMQYGRPISHGKLEWANANVLLSNGIGAYEPVCFGERTNFGFEVESFVVTAQLAGQALDKFVFHNWKSLPSDQQDKIIVRIAETVRKVHKLNISLRDLYASHIFILHDSRTGQFEPAFIDLENMSRHVISNIQKARDLGRLCYSMSEEFFDRDSKDLLIDTYLVDRRSWPKAILKQIILGREREMAKRRKLTPYRA